MTMENNKKPHSKEEIKQMHDALFASIENKVNTPEEWGGSKGEAKVYSNTLSCSVCIGENDIAEFRHDEDAHLWVDAHTTIQKYGKLPSQLLLENEKYKSLETKDLWEHMSEEHGLTLLLSELHEIQAICKKPINDELERLKDERDEFKKFAEKFTNAIETEEIIINENFDNDGFENCGGRLYSEAKELLTKHQR